MMAAALITTGPLVADEPETVSYIGLTVGPTTASNCRDLANDWPSPFTNALAWSDGQLPHHGPVYVAGMTNGAASRLWTPIQSADTTYDSFKTLILHEGCTLYIRHRSGKTATFRDLRAEGGGTVDIWNPNVATTRLAGGLYIEDGTTLQLRSYNGRAIAVDSKISGGGLLYCRSQIGTSAYKASFGLYADNSDFLGKVKVTSGFDSPTFTSCSHLTVTNATSLGGTLSGELSDTHDALTLQNMSVLHLGGKDMVLPADSNRGILISTRGGRIDVPETAGTVTLNWPVTLTKSVHFYKEGTGHLVLGNTLHFLNKSGVFLTSTVSGVDCHYYIDVREGTVSVTDCHAMDGAHIAFSNETAFVMSVNPPEGDLKTYGLRCDKSRYAPLDTTMPIRLRADNGGKLTEGRYVISLVTVGTAYADDVAEKLSIEELPSHYRLLGVTPVAAEGVSKAVTFKAEIVRRGMTVSLR